MNTSRYVIGSLAVFVYIFLFEFLYHGMFLTSQYMLVEQLMRPEPEFFGLFHWIIIGELLMAFFFCLIFIKGYEGKGIGEGVRFGLLIGIGFGVSSREAVDELYEELTKAGYRGQQPPFDAFWGARFAVVEDPDGNAVGLMSPRDPARRSVPTPP